MSNNGNTATNMILRGDCLDLMDYLPSGSVDMILADLPYGTTACKWDTVIPFVPLWAQYERIIKPNGAIVLTASFPFSGALWASKPALFRYDFTWIKTKASNFQLARKMPMKRHENVLVFYKALPTFNLSLTSLDRPIKQSRKNKGGNLGHCVDAGDYVQTETGFAFTDLYFANPSGTGHLHPSQKPVELFEYLIRTYTNPGELVLDNCIGSGTTAIACLNTDRAFIGMEKEPEHYETACKRVAEHPLSFLI